MQSSIFNVGTGLTFPSTKTIATKQHMAVWLRDIESGDWEQMSVARYDLINNSAVVKAASDMEGFSILELRVADNPDELGSNPASIAIVANNIDEVIICADNISDIISLAENMDSITVVYQNIDSVITCADNITEIKAAPAAASEATQSATQAELDMWNSQAEAMTSDSYANEPENVLVKNWTSNGDGTFTPTDVPNTYSSLHWAIQAAMSVLGLNFQGIWDASTGNYPTTRPPEGSGDPLEAGDLYIISVAGNIDGTDYFIGDRLVLDSALAWVRVPNIVDWGSIQSVPENVVNAVDNTGDIMLGNLEAPSMSIGGNYVSPYAMRNKLINGGFDVWKRGSIFSTDGYTADRWLVTTTGGATQTVEQVVATTGTDRGLFHLQYNVTSPNIAGQTLVQRIENVKTIYNTKATMSLFFRLVSGAIDSTLNMVVRQDFGDGGSPSVSTTYSHGVISAGAQEKIEYTFDIPDITGKTIGDNSFIEIRFTMISSTAYNLRFYEVQFEEGSVATPFEQRPIGLEVSLCQRYFQSWGRDFLDNLGLSVLVGSRANESNISVSLPLSVPLRKTPTLVNTGTFTARDGDGVDSNAVCTGHTGINNNVIGLNFSTSLVPNSLNVCGVNANINGGITLDSEL